MEPMFLGQKMKYRNKEESLKVSFSMFINVKIGYDRDFGGIEFLVLENHNISKCNIQRLYQN